VSGVAVVSRFIQQRSSGIWYASEEPGVPSSMRTVCALAERANGKTARAAASNADLGNMGFSFLGRSARDALSRGSHDRTQDSWNRKRHAARWLCGPQPRDADTLTLRELLRPQSCTGRCTSCP
jgi:hypothetical protein